MTVGIVGGGFTGLTAALELLKKGHTVTIFERQSFWGGLASSFEIVPGVFIERFYHHLFTNDQEILDLCQELGISRKLKVLDGKTSHLYADRIYPLDSPWAVLRFSPLSFIERLRFGLVTLYLKIKGKGTGFDEITADQWLKRWYGERAYQVVWKPLLQGKFAQYFDQISMEWFWARVKKRTEKLIYPNGGFQVIIDTLIREIESRGGQLLSGVRIEGLNQRSNDSWRLRSVVIDTGLSLEHTFDKLIFTPSLKAFIQALPNLPADYRRKIESIEYLYSQVLILVLSKRLSNHYWINIGDSSYPFLVVGEQSNLLGLDYYHGKSIVYLGNYLAEQDFRLGLSADQLVDLFLPFIKRINPLFDKSWIESAYSFVGPAAQPIVDLNYKSRIPPFETPLKNLYLATMAQVYPWDRGTNYAVKLAKDLVRSYF